MLTHRRSISAVWGYSSLSIMFFEEHSAISSSASGSIQVVTKVARLSRALPSSISSSWMIWKAARGGMPLSARRRSRYLADLAVLGELRPEAQFLVVVGLGRVRVEWH